MAIPLLQNQGPVGQSRPIIPLASGSSARLARSNAIMATSQTINEPLQMLDLARSQAQQGAAIGGAIAQAGGVLEQIAMKRLEAKNYADMAEAETEAQGAMAKHLDWRMRNPNPEGWATNFEETFAKTRSAIEAKGFAPLVRDKLKISLDSLAMKGRVDVGLAATKTEIDRATTQASSRYENAVQAGDMMGVDSALADFVQLTGADADTVKGKRIAAQQTIQGNQLQTLGTRLNMAAQTGDEATVQTLKAQGMALAGNDDRLKLQVESMEQTARLNAQRVKEQATNQERGKLYENIVYQMAQGAPIVPAQIDSLVKEGKLDDGAAANLRRAAQDGTGAPPGQFQEFLTKRVMTYGKEADPMGNQWAEIQREAVGLGLSSIQAQQFQGVFKSSMERNATQAGRTQSALRTWARSHIGDMHKAGAFGAYEMPAAGINPDITGALSDVAKMGKVLGVTPNKETDASKQDLATKIAATVKRDPQAALDMFAKAYKVPQKDSGLDEGSYNFLMKSVTPSTDRVKEGDSGATSAQIQDNLDVWFDEQSAQGKTPSQQEVQMKVKDLTKTYQDSQRWNVFSPPVPTKKTVSIRGFEDAPDLKDKLPEPLQAHAQDFIDAARENGLDPRALAAIAMHETGNGLSKAFREKNNAMGVSDSSGPKTMSSVRDSIFAQARSLARPGGYYNGKSTIDEIAGIYAPVGAANDPTSLNQYWAGGVLANYAKLTN